MAISSLIRLGCRRHGLLEGAAQTWPRLAWTLHYAYLFTQQSDRTTELLTRVCPSQGDGDSAAMVDDQAGGPSTSAGAARMPVPPPLSGDGADRQLGVQSGTEASATLLLRLWPGKLVDRDDEDAEGAARKVEAYDAMADTWCVLAFRVYRFWRFTWGRHAIRGGEMCRRPNMTHQRLIELLAG